MQACEGYVENGHFYPIDTLMSSTGRWRAVLTVLDEPVREELQSDSISWIDEFNRLVDESANEELNIEDFPRMSFGREFVSFDEKR